MKSEKFLTRGVSALREFAKNRTGGVAVTFGVAFPVVAFLSLVIVDYSRASTAKQSMQEALDAAALIVARSSAVQPDDVDAVGDKAFAAQLPANSGLDGLTPNGQGRIDNVTFTPTGNKIVGEAHGTVSPMVASIVLNGPMHVDADSEVLRSVTKLEIALVLDTTGSMQGTKITNLITAAKSFVSTMQTAAAKSTETDPIKISVVPFSTTVRVADPLTISTAQGGNYNSTSHSLANYSWLDGRALGTAWNNDIFTNVNNATAAQRVDRFVKLANMGVKWGGCVENRLAPYDIRETAPDSSTPATMFVPFFWPDEFDDGTSSTSSKGYLNDYYSDGNNTNVTNLSSLRTRQGVDSKYSGSFKSSANSSGFLPNSAYAVHNWAFGPNAACDMQKIKRLSTDFGDIKTHIDGLVASGETNIPIGLMWGWHTLSPLGPFGDGISYALASNPTSGPKTQKIIILMTDGDNTMNSPINSSNLNGSYYHGYGYQWQGRLVASGSSASARTTAMDNRLAPASGNAENLCGNIKEKNIQIYTVGVGVSTNSKALLQRCATAITDYYDVDSSGSSLNDAFSAIAGRIENLRISH